ARAARIEIIPLECDGLAEPEARTSHEEEQRVQARVVLLRHCEEPLELLAIQGLDQLLARSRRRDQAQLPTESIGRIGQEDAGVYRGVQHREEGRVHETCAVARESLGEFLGQKGLDTTWCELADLRFAEHQ